MASSEEELRLLLVEVGSKLENPPTSVKELLPLLDRVEVYLSRVEQSPSKAILNALSPTMKALVGDELLRHEDIDVKASVGSCISEITRITAPDVPYDDDQMKEVFQLIISSFESLGDTSSQSYSKRMSILETVAKVRSSVVMLDLECDGLILEMFRHFIKEIRDYHPEDVYSCMESIMTGVIEESEVIPSDLLFCIMDTVRKDNKEVMPIAQKLMKKVIETRADKLKPYFENEMRTKGVSLADYDEVLSLICNEASAVTVVQLQHTDASIVKAVDACKPVVATVDTTAEEIQAVAMNSTELPASGCSELVKSNDNGAVEADTFSGSSSLKDSKSSNIGKTSETVTTCPPASDSHPDSSGVEADTKASETIIENPEIKDGDMDAEKLDEGELTNKPIIEKIPKKRGRKAKAKRKAAESKLAGKSSNSVKQLEGLAESHKSCSKNMPTSPNESLNEAAGDSSPRPLKAHDGPSKEIHGESDTNLNGSPKSKTAISSLEYHSLLDENTTPGGHLKEETATPIVDNSKLKTAVSAFDASTDNNNALNNGENATTVANDGLKEVTAPTIDELMKEIKTSAGKSLEKVSDPSEDAHKLEDSLKTKEGIKKRGRGKGKATLQKLAAQAAFEDNNKEASASHKSTLNPVNNKEEKKETPKTSNKKRHIEAKSNESKDHGEELIGSKVRVWWPADKRFYKGVIESFDSAKKRHKVLYADGEAENLSLKRQRWEVIGPNENSDTDEEKHQKTPTNEKHHKAGANEGTSKKRLGRPPSMKSKSASNKPGRKPKDLAKSGSMSKDDSKGAKENTDISKEEKSKENSSKRLGRPRVDVSKSTGGSIMNDPSENAAGKPEVDGSTEEDASSSGKLKGSDSKASIKGESDSNTAGILEDDSISLKQMDTKGKVPKSGNVIPVIEAAGKSKIRKSRKSKSGLTAKEETLRAVFDAKSDGVSPKNPPKSGVKAPTETEVESSDSEDEEAAKKQTPSPVKAAGSSKRKASVMEKENKSRAMPEVKGKKERKH